MIGIILHFFHISGHTSAAAVVVATHTHHHHQHGAVHHARLRSSIEDSPPSLRFMADTVPAQVVDTSVISSASASPKLIVQTDYPVNYLVLRILSWNCSYTYVFHLGYELLKMTQKSQDTVDHTPAGTGNYFSHGSLSKFFFVEFKSESLKNKKVSKFQQL